MHLLPRMNVMLDFIWTLQSRSEEHRTNEHYKKMLSMVGFEPQHDTASRLQVHRLSIAINEGIQFPSKSYLYNL